MRTRRNSHGEIIADFSNKVNARGKFIGASFEAVCSWTRTFRHTEIDALQNEIVSFIFSDVLQKTALFAKNFKFFKNLLTHFETRAIMSKLLRRKNGALRGAQKNLKKRERCIGFENFFLKCGKRALGKNNGRLYYF